MVADKAILLVAVAFILIAGAQAYDAGAHSAGDSTDVTNESWTSDPGNWTTLNNSNTDGATYSTDVTVYNSSDAEMDAGTDYDWNQSTGEVKALSGGDLDPAQSANITYDYSEYDERQQGINQIVGDQFQVAHLLLFVLTAGLLVAGLRFLTGV